MGVYEEVDAEELAIAAGGIESANARLAGDAALLMNVEHCRLRE